MDRLTSKYEEADIVQPGGCPIPEALKPCMQTFFIKNNQVRLRVMLARTSNESTRGSVIFSPGRTEFIEKYFETAADFIERGFNVLIVDPRGQGLSDRLLDDKLKSHVELFEDYVDDLTHVVKELLPLLPRPHVLMGHSMGGTIVLQTILRGDLKPEAVICSAPMLGLYDLDTSIMKLAIKGLSALGLKTKILPLQGQRNGLPVSFNINKLTSDKDRYRHWAAYFQTSPRLRVGRPTYGWIVQALKAMTWVNSNASQLKIPCLIVAAGADPIVDPASNENFASISRSTYKVIPGALHELLLERDVYRDQFLEVFDTFLKNINI